MGGARTLGVVGLALLLAGVLALVVPGITYQRERHTLDLGPIHATAEHRETYPVPRTLAVIAIGVGAGLAIAGLRRA